jgi:hypothetical protein
MLIKYQPNPLNTIIELDAHDIEILRLKITISELEERIYSAGFHLEPGERFSVETARLRLGADTLEEHLSKSVPEHLDLFVAELRGSHAGDCTCVPCSCMKCQAEELLGISTIEGLGKHPAHYMESAFADGRDIDAAIAYLDDYRPSRTGVWLGHPQEEFDQHAPRWTREVKHAAAWLRRYRDDVYLPSGVLHG